MLRLFLGLGLNRPLVAGNVVPMLGFAGVVCMPGVVEGGGAGNALLMLSR
jgi:hypothetical protein